MHNYSLRELEEKSTLLRELYGKMVKRFPLFPDHFLTSPQLLTALYSAYLNHDPRNPHWEDRDRVYWAGGTQRLLPLLTLALCAYFPVEMIGSAAKTGSSILPKTVFPGIEARFGLQESSLGVAAGAAIEARMSGRDHRIVCLMDESEQQRGSTWEAAMTAGRHELGNLLLIVSRLRGTAAGWTSPCPKKLEALADKYAAFEWHVLLANGNKVEDILENIPAADSREKDPTVLILDVEEEGYRTPPRSGIREQMIAEKVRVFLRGRHEAVPAIVIEAQDSCEEYHSLSMAMGMALSGRRVVYVADPAALPADDLMRLGSFCSEDSEGHLSIVLSGDGSPPQRPPGSICFENPGNIRGVEEALKSVMRKRGVSILRWPADQAFGVEETVSSYGEKI